MDEEPQRVCEVCGREKCDDDLVSGHLVRESIAELIRRDHPGWTPDASICREDLDRYRAEYVRSVLVAERGELTEIEREVLESLKEGEILTRDVNAEFDEKRTIGERLADRLAAFGGSWKFISLFMGVLALWIVTNSLLLLRRPFDPYPFILLNLVLSCLAALQAPVIMMSQNRQETKDRLRAQHDYQVNLKAEIEIRSLHDKLDHMIFKQQQRLLEIQEIQTELMAELSERLRTQGDSRRS
jgi:uncharacterized membrane protein